MHITLLLGLIGLTSALRNPPIRRHFTKRQDESSPPTTVPGYNFSMPVDHFNEDDARTYNNRFWVNDTYYQPGGPVFLFDEGEASVTDASVDAFLAETHGLSAVMELTRSFHGMAILWEHRYYGLSWPVPMVLKNGTAVDPATCGRLGDACTLEPQGGPDGYKYLTVDQALEDVAYFAQHVKIPGYSDNEMRALSASNSPWVFIGGSYPGARAAWVRARNPETFVASWASSPPTEAMVDGSPYFDGVYRALPSTCAADITAVIRYVDEVIEGKHGAAALTYLQQLAFASIQPPTPEVTVAANLTGYQIGELLLAPLVTNFQYVPPVNSTDVLCRYMQSYNPLGQPSNTTDAATKVLSNPGDRNSSSSSRGIVDSYGALEGLNAYAYASHRYLAKNPMDDDTPTADMKSWVWQTFTQFGFQQGSNPENHDTNIVSRFFNWTAVYEKQRTETYTFGTRGIPDVPDVATLNRFGGWDMKVSNVMFTNGEFDPWRQFSVMTQEQQSLRPVTQDVPQCNVAPAGTNVFGLLYPGAVHCSDLHQSRRYPMDGTAPVQIGVGLFEKALAAWLPCFKPSSSESKVPPASHPWTVTNWKSNHGGKSQ